MRRHRGLVVNFCLFVFALLCIIWFNRTPAARPRIYAWTIVRYKSIGKPPPSRGVCPGIRDTTKPALVVARTSTEDKSWISSLSNRYHACVYTADAPLDASSNELQLPQNRGHEAMAYLTFMIDNYASLPKAIVFIHGSRFAWHNDHPLYDNLKLLESLDVERALGTEGYYNLRCDWSASMCPAEVLPQGSIETRTRAMLEPGNQRAISDAALVGALDDIFGTGSKVDSNGLPSRLGRTDPVRAQCSAQFVVSRKNILRHSKEEYIALRQWLLDGSKTEYETGEEYLHLQNQRQQRGRASPAPAEDYISGRILSFVWHILFLPAASGGGVDLTRLNTMACPSAADCYCRLYGRCNLDGCRTSGRCAGQYEIPRGYRLPADWAEKHS